MRSTRRRAARAPIATVTAGLAVAALAIGSPHIPRRPRRRWRRRRQPRDPRLRLRRAASVTATVKDESGKGRDGLLPTRGRRNCRRPVGRKGPPPLGRRAGSTTSPYITVPAGLFQGLTSTTISSWVKWDGGDAFQWLYTLGKDKDSAAFYTPRFQGDDKARSNVKPTTQGEVGASGSTALPTGEWHLVTTTIDSGALVSYLDGLEVSRTTVGADVSSALFGSSSPTSGYIGQPFWTGVHPFFAGAIDDFQVYDTALTPGQVRALAGDAAPKLTTVLQKSVEVQTDVGAAPNLPGVKPSSTMVSSASLPSPGPMCRHPPTPSAASSPSPARWTGPRPRSPRQCASQRRMSSRSTSATEPGRSWAARPGRSTGSTVPASPRTI